MARKEETYQHPVLDRGGKRRRGCITVALIATGVVSWERKGVTSSLGAMVGKRRGRFLEDGLLRVDIFESSIVMDWGNQYDGLNGIQQNIKSPVSRKRWSKIDELPLSIYIVCRQSLMSHVWATMVIRANPALVARFYRLIITQAVIRSETAWTPIKRARNWIEWIMKTGPQLGVGSSQDKNKHASIAHTVELSMIRLAEARKEGNRN